MKTKKVFVRRKDGRSLFMAPHGLVRPGDEFDEINSYYLKQGFFTEKIVEVKKPSPPKVKSPVIEPKEAAIVEVKKAPKERVDPLKEEPLEGYDSLTAREVVALIDMSLSLEEVEKIRAYEASHRKRKTVIRKAKSQKKELASN